MQLSRFILVVCNQYKQNTLCFVYHLHVIIINFYDLLNTTYFSEAQLFHQNFIILVIVYKWVMFDSRCNSRSYV